MAVLRLDLSLPHDLPDELPVICLRRGALLPGAVLPLQVGRESSLAALRAARGWLLVGAQLDGAVTDPGPADLLGVATLARVVERRRANEGLVAVVHGVRRVRLGAFEQTEPHLRARFEVLAHPWPEDQDALGRRLRDRVSAAAERLGASQQAGTMVRALRDPGVLADAVAGMLPEAPGWRQDLLSTLDPVVRAKEVIAALGRVLGDDEGGDALREKLNELSLPGQVREAVDRELRRLDRINPQSPERGVAMDWLGWIAELPWGEPAAADASLDAVEQALSVSHHGLDEVKRQVVEHLAVRQLSGSGRADVLLLVGPPGVGKTSIGTAIAEATGRPLVRVALGGVRDEAELRGHRRTYIGARPGRIVEGLRRASRPDVVMLLDEVDKLGVGFRGDPAAALLEILDPEQNHAFTDHYLEVPFDLSRVLFVATANDTATIPAPLLDRMEVLRVPGYTPEEKRLIARDHLLGKLAGQAGLEPEELALEEGVVAEVIAGWTREAGVRQLQRSLGRLYRAAAVKKARGELDEALLVRVDDLPELLGRRKVRPSAHEDTCRPGVATGLAWAPVGGDVLYVEASTLPGKGQLLLTGQLGDVMRESARAALTWVLSEGGGPTDGLLDQDVHVHVPAGAVPKDGPSAGVTIATALASMLSGRPVRNDVAMTGEATLRGRVLPVGGIPSKVLAAQRLGLKTIILPRANEADLDELPADAREALEFVFVDDLTEVVAAALV